MSKFRITVYHTSTQIYCKKMNIVDLPNARKEHSESKTALGHCGLCGNNDFHIAVYLLQIHLFDSVSDRRYVRHLIYGIE